MRHPVRQGRANTSILQVKCDCHVCLLESGAGKRIQPKMVKDISPKVFDQREYFILTGKNGFKFLSKDKPHLLMPFDIISKPTA